MNNRPRYIVQIDIYVKIQPWITRAHCTQNDRKCKYTNQWNASFSTPSIPPLPLQQHPALWYGSPRSITPPWWMMMTWWWCMGSLCHFWNNKIKSNLQHTPLFSGILGVHCFTRDLHPEIGTWNLKPLGALSWNWSRFSKRKAFSGCY